MLASSSPTNTGNSLLLVNTIDNAIGFTGVENLAGAIPRNALLVMNDSATLPASLSGIFEGSEVELRLTGQRKGSLWQVLVFGAGNHQTSTEERPRGPDLSAGDRIELKALVAVVRERGAHRRLAWVELIPTEGTFWHALYASGKPVQYAYAPAPVDLWDVQTTIAARPWSVEMPSAARPLSSTVILRLVSEGVAIATLTHAAGLSSTGDADLDAQLPFDEAYDIPMRTARAVEDARAQGRPIIAVGTSVVRALESCARDHGGQVVAGQGIARLRLSESFVPKIVSALVTGVHEPGSSHWELLRAFVKGDLLQHAALTAEQNHMKTHEWGDTCLVGAWA